MVRILFIVHGAVQGVGYRAMVKRIADNLGVLGRVRNMPDGSVEVLAVSDAATLGNFEVGLYIYDEYGPKVFRIEKIQESDPKFPAEYAETEYLAFKMDKEVD